MTNQTLDQIRRHRSIRRFKDRPVDSDTLSGLVSAAQCAATSHHVQAYTIIHVTDPENRQTIANLAGPQPWVARAPVFLVFCADLTRLVKAAQSHGIPPETGWAEQLIVATVDTALLAQNLMIAAESVGLGGVFIGGIRNDPETVAQLLCIPDQAFPVFGMCLGYPDETPEIKPRFPVDMVLKKDTFFGPNGEPDPEEDRSDMAEFDSLLNAYYRRRSEKLKDRDWSKSLGEFTGQIIRPGMKAFLRKRGFFLK
ncbi:MAG TPA: oxygen-insensitive NADPH nitroreductase [Desulfobacteraceae bacterium]|nr:oxygen-insensitive NADPH nitroreductase [Desulfobacteraceae bacterium]